MNYTELRRDLSVIGWSVRTLAGRLSCDESTVRRWSNGSHPIPPAIAEWIEATATHHRLSPPPPPEAWRQRGV